MWPYNYVPLEGHKYKFDWTIILAPVMKQKAFIHVCLW